MPSTIRPSPELMAVLDRWQEAFRVRDTRTLVNLLSRDASLRYVGSDEGECWTDDLLRSGFAEHAGEVPDFAYSPEFSEAFECGPCGWALWVGGLTFAGQDEPRHHRFSFVFALEDGVWRITQLHCSNPIANMEKLGVEHQAMEALAQRAREGFRLDQKVGVATIMFTDVVGSTELSVAAGDQVWASPIAMHLDHVAATITRHDGQVVKTLGDGAMASFASTSAALAAAAELHQSAATATDAAVSLPLRMGLHCGDVIQAKDDFFGNVVNKTARIAATASAGEARVSDDVRLSATADDFAFTSPALAALKGFDGEQLTHLLNWKA